MILIEGIPVLAARLAAEQKAKEWLAKTRRSASDTTQRASIDRPFGSHQALREGSLSGNSPHSRQEARLP
jgi:hypothetical protein